MINISAERWAYWGASNIPWVADGTESRSYMRPLQAVGRRVKLEAPENDEGVLGKILNGMVFTTYGGRACWDKAGKTGF